MLTRIFLLLRQCLLLYLQVNFKDFIEDLHDIYDLYTLSDVDVIENKPHAPQSAVPIVATDMAAVLSQEEDTLQDEVVIAVSKPKKPTYTVIETSHRGRRWSDQWGGKEEVKKVVKDKKEVVNVAEEKVEEVVIVAEEEKVEDKEEVVIAASDDLAALSDDDGAEDKEEVEAFK
jgi:PHD/YefM family antitoxin component YafN of YafNO toxin-antitoxin module